MLASGNDTATALARVAGGVPQTVARMQAEAVRLGARDTTVRNPSGLDAPGQATSAYDLALVARAAMQLPAFRTLVTTKRVRFPGKEVAGKARTSFQIQNHNKLLYNYTGTIGVKDGYTVAARWTAISAVQRGGHRYLFTAMRRGEPSWRTQAAMFDWAFAHGAQVRPVGRLVDPGELERRGHRHRRAASVAAAGPTLPRPCRRPRAATTARWQARRRRWGGGGAARRGALRAQRAGQASPAGRRLEPRRSGRHGADRRANVEPQRPARPTPPANCRPRRTRVADHAGSQPEHRTGRDRRAVGRARAERRQHVVAWPRRVPAVAPAPRWAGVRARWPSSRPTRPRAA